MVNITQLAEALSLVGILVVRPGDDEAFNAIWDALASESRCDDRGGAEYTRVLDEWRRSGYAIAVTNFIMQGTHQQPGSAATLCQCDRD